MIFLNKKIIAAVLCVAVLFNIIFYADCLAVSGDDIVTVKILVFENLENLNFYISGNYKCFAPFSEYLLFEGKNLNAEITPFQNGIQVNNKKYKIFGMKFIPEKDFYINNLPYKGEVLILRSKNNKIKIINYINLSDYLKGVLYNEISHKWPIESIKAQAVASRTYAFYSIIKNKKKYFDLKSDVSSQVYRGVNSERKQTNIAVEETSGQILTFNGKVFPSFFHACSGGYTEDSKNIWNIDLEVLKGVKDNFSKGSPYFFWTVKLSLSNIEKKLNKSAYKIGKLLNIFVLNKNKSGRIANLILFGKNRSILIASEEFRRILGYNVIKSTNFRINKNHDVLVFKGHGWGHGVGMSQWGAYFMSIRGYNFNDILNYYYPGSKIVHISQIIK